MADNDVIGGLDNLIDAVSGETPAYQYKDPNTDMMKAISKCIDAADGTIDDQYEYKNPNTDVIQKMDELATAIAEGGGGIDYFESWIITNNSTTMSVHNEYNNNGSISSCRVYSQGGNVTQVEGDMNIRIGENTGWKWQMIATADMTYRVYDVINGILSELRTATNGTVVLSNVDITGNITYEIRRYS